MGGSKSSSSAATNQTDNRKVLGEGSLNAENSSINQTSYSLDNGAVNRAFDSTDRNVSESFAFGTNALQTVDNAQTKAFMFGNNALLTADNASTKSLIFGNNALLTADKAQERAYGFASGVLDNNLDTTRAAFSYGADSQGSAYEFSKGILGRAVSFAEDANDRALDSLNTTANLVKDSYADAKGRGALTDQILIGAIAMAGIVAFTALKK